MALWQFNSESQNFNGSCIIPATTFPYVFAEPFDVHIVLNYSYTSLVYGTDNEDKFDIYFTIKGYDSNGGYPYLLVALDGPNGQPERCGVAINTMGLDIINISGVHSWRVDYGAWTDDPITSASDFPGTFAGPMTENGEITIEECNIPLIFDSVPNDTSDITFSEYMWYLGNTDTTLNMNGYSPKAAPGYNILTRDVYQHCYNFISEEVPGQEFSITNVWNHGTWTVYGCTTTTPPKTLGVRGKLTEGSKLSFYNIPGISNGKLKLGIKLTGEVEACEYLNENGAWVPTTTFPYTFLYRKREDELGTFDFALQDISSPFPIFDSEHKADLYNQGLLDPSEALNWDRISMYYPPTNPTETGETSTTMGEAGNRGIFSQYYIVPLTVLYELANGLYDTDNGGMFEDIKKGLEMYGQDCIEAVSNLAFYPLDLSAVLPGANQSHIYFGGYKFNLTSGNAYRVANHNGYKTLGSMTIKRAFNSWRDYEPYTKLYIFIPYAGTFQLDLSRYYGKLTELRYYFDITCNMALVCLLADGKLTDYWNVQMGVNMPITMTNFAMYAQTQIQTLIGGVQSGVGGSVDIAGQTSGALSKGLGSTASGVAGGVAAGLMIDKTIMKTAYGLSQNNINNYNKTKGGATSLLNEFLPQYPYFIFETQEDCAPDNYGDMFGYPSMKSGTINSFGGFLKVHDVKLNCPGATESEKEKIIALLKQGVYI